MTTHVEETLVLVKPDGVARNLTGQVLARIEAKGYVIGDLRLGEHRGQPARLPGAHDIREPRQVVGRERKQQPVRALRQVADDHFWCRSLALLPQRDAGSLGHGAPAGGVQLHQYATADLRAAYRRLSPALRRVPSISTWPEIEAFLQRSKTVVVPIGSNEQHGPTGLLGTDWLCPEIIAHEAQKSGDILVAPTFNIGMAQHHLDFPGTIALRPSRMSSSGRSSPMRGSSSRSRRRAVRRSSPRPCSRRAHPCPARLRAWANIPSTRCSS